MRVSDIMTGDVKTAAPTDAAEDAFRSMRLHRIRHLVVAEGRRVIGIVSDRDLGGPRGAALRSGRTIDELMTRGVVTATRGTTVRQAANLLRGRTIGCLPVMEEGKLVGIVTVSDLLELVGSVGRHASTDARWKPVRRMGRWPRNAERKRVVRPPSA